MCKVVEVDNETYSLPNSIMDFIGTLDGDDNALLYALVNSPLPAVVHVPRTDVQCDVQTVTKPTPTEQAQVAPMVAVVTETFKETVHRPYECSCENVAHSSYVRSWAIAVPVIAGIVYYIALRVM